MEELEIGSAKYTTRLTGKFKNRPHWTRPDEKRVMAVIPGNIQQVMIQAGQEVAAGSPMLILEAMKMRNQVKAPLTGVVKAIHVKEGDMVAKNQLLLEFA